MFSIMVFVLSVALFGVAAFVKSEDRSFGFCVLGVLVLLVSTIIYAEEVHRGVW